MPGLIWSNEERIKVVLEWANPLECVRSIFSLKKFTDHSEKIDPGNQTNFTPLEHLEHPWWFIGRFWKNSQGPYW